jgi:hypothetical protein
MAKADVEDTLYEMDVLLPIVSSAVIINLLAFITAQIGWGAFNTAMQSTNLVSHSLQGFYFISTTMITVGYGDIAPKNHWGQFVAILMHVQSLLLIVGMFSSLMSFGLKGDTGTDGDSGAVEDWSI